MTEPTNNKKTADSDLTPNRWAVGLITLGCFVAAAGMWLGGYAQDGTTQFAFSGLIRVGIFMSTVWLALPGGGRVAAWAGMSPWVMVFLALGVFLIKLKYLGLVVVAMLVLGAFIKPKSKKKSAGQKKTVSATASTVRAAEPKEDR